MGAANSILHSPDLAALEGRPAQKQAGAANSKFAAPAFGLRKVRYLRFRSPVFLPLSKVWVSAK